ncbi:MAG: alpha/beta hydrolase [Bacteroidales bacterium]|nr:alpha/beta hydrolase [Bacteroidales bacterium]
MIKLCISIFGLIIMMASSDLNSQQVIRLYPGKAPGSENWNWQEKNMGGGFLMDVTDPTITVFLPEKPNGISVIVAPGGAYHYLVTDGEGSAVARRLNEKGITAFVLKYRLVHEDPAHPYIQKMLQTKDWKLLDSVSAPLMPLATQDGLTAVKYVRDHAIEYNIDPDKIGFEGSSAGGTVAMNVVCNATDENRPNFVATLYGYGEALAPCTKIPTVRTPLFVSAAVDDELVPIQHSFNFISKWLAAKQPVEVHIYQKGNHGFVGNKPQNLPVDSWFDRLVDWIFMLYPA